MKAEEFDEKFDNGEDVSAYLNLDSGRHPNLMVKRINIDCPQWMITALDQASTQLNISRQSLIKFWLADKLQHRT